MMNKKDDLAIVFPGQGSQKVGMLADYAVDSIVVDTFQQASEALDYDLWQTVVGGPQEKLNLTEITQPIMLTSSIALWRVWQDLNGSAPSYMAGHSLGEWSALVASGVVSFKDAVQIVRLRGKYMQDAVAPGEGAMAAIIGLEDEVVEKICSDLSGEGVVSAVNYNSPGQLVIAGSAKPVAKAIEACKTAGAKKAMALPVSAPFHTSLMKPAADKLAEKIQKTKFSAPQIPVVHNVDAKTRSDATAVKNIMIEQIYNSVRWVSCVLFLRGHGVDKVVECGPGKVLSGLNRRIDKSIKSFNCDTPAAMATALESV